MLDESELAALYERYGFSLYRRCLSLVGHEEDARELLQEAFLQFWRGRSRFERRSSAFTFLYRIATNLAIDKLRRRRTAGIQHSLIEENHLAHGSDGRVGQVVAAQELAVLTEGLDQESVMVAVMVHVDGMSQDEIAAALGLSRRTIGKRLQAFLAHTRQRSAAMQTAEEGAHEQG